MRAIVGLGNPGIRYAKTRHNIGFMLVNRVLAHLGVRLRRAGPFYEVCETRWLGEDVVFVEPSTFVNRSGLALAELQRQQRLELESMLVVVDDVYLPFGRPRLRAEGSDGGHNGLASIEACLGSRRYPRLRLGVGGPKAGQALHEHVLSAFDADEFSQLDAYLQLGQEILQEVVRHGVGASLSKVNAWCLPG